MIISKFDIFIINIKIYLYTYTYIYARKTKIGEYFIYKYFIFMHKISRHIVVVKKKWWKYAQFNISYFIYGYAPKVRIDKESKCGRRIEIF